MTAVSGQRDRVAPRRGAGDVVLLRAVTFGQGGRVDEFGVGTGFSHRSALQLQAVRAVHEPIEDRVRQRRLLVFT